MDEELELIELIRAQMVRILRPLGPEPFQRRGIHSEDGPLTLETLLRRITEQVHRAEEGRTEIENRPHRTANHE